MLDVSCAILFFFTMLTLSMLLLPLDMHRACESPKSCWQLQAFKGTVAHLIPTTWYPLANTKVELPTSALDGAAAAGTGLGCSSSLRCP